MFIISIIILVYILNNKKLLIIIFFILIIISISQSLNYNPNTPGGKYYPTKLVYEKMDIVVDSKGITNYLEEYITLNNISSTKVIFLGLGGIDKSGKFNLSVQYRYSENQTDKEMLNEMINFIDKNKKENIFVIAHPSAFANRINLIYYYLWDGQKYITEINPIFTQYLESSKVFECIYISEDGYSKIYKLKKLNISL
jgi:hypothetical protein